MCTGSRLIVFVVIGLLTSVTALAQAVIHVDPNAPN